MCVMKKRMVLSQQNNSPPPALPTVCAMPCPFSSELGDIIPPLVLLSSHIFCLNPGLRMLRLCRRVISSMVQQTFSEAPQRRCFRLCGLYALTGCYLTSAGASKQLGRVWLCPTGVYLNSEPHLSFLQLSQNIFLLVFLVISFFAFFFFKCKAILKT